MDKISVIVPVYKVEKYLEACVNSIINQTFDNLEIILVNDHSLDSCGDLCDHFAETDLRIKVVHKQKNEGLSCARNTGIENATGDYICFVDSDDLIAPTYCEVLYNLLVNSSADFSVCGSFRFRNENEIKTVRKSANVCEYSNRDFLELQLDKKSEFGVWNKLFRRECFSFLKFAEGKLNEDVIFSADLYKKLSNGVVVTDEKLHFYRQNDSGIVAMQKIKPSEHFLVAGEYLVNNIDKKDSVLYNKAVAYMFSYPWSFVDSIVLKRAFKDNKAFMNMLVSLIGKYKCEIKENSLINPIVKHRMLLFGKSRFLFCINAYARLMRVYLFKIIKKDAYKSGHGI